jgi:hypothetical protein
MIVSADRIHRDGDSLYVAVPGTTPPLPPEALGAFVIVDPSARVPDPEWLALDRPCDLTHADIRRLTGSPDNPCPDCFNGRHTFTLEEFCDHPLGRERCRHCGWWTHGMIEYTVSVAQRSDNWPGGFIPMFHNNNTTRRNSAPLIEVWDDGEAWLWTHPEALTARGITLPSAARPGDYLVKFDVEKVET